MASRSAKQVKHILYSFQWLRCSDDGVVDVMADCDSYGYVQIGDSADGDGGADGYDRDNTSGDDGNSESTDDGQFIPVTVDEVSKLFSKS